MRCPACKSEMEDGLTELVFKRNRSVIVIEGIPAVVCKQCGEASIDLNSSQTAYELAEREMKRGVSLEFCKFKAA